MYKHMYMLTLNTHTKLKNILRLRVKEVTQREDLALGTAVAVGK